jgi:hypothetical protein
MIGTAITTCVTFVVLFVVVAVLVQVEERRGRRVILASLRNSLDATLQRFQLWLDNTWSHFLKYVVRLGWYYSIHSLLRAILSVLVSIYTYVEAVFERNREKTKLLRRERKQKQQTHFSQIADHKSEVALTPEAEAAFLHDKLHNDH